MLEQLPLYGNWLLVLHWAMGQQSGVLYLVPFPSAYVWFTSHVAAGRPLHLPFPSHLCLPRARRGSSVVPPLQRQAGRPIYIPFPILSHSCLFVSSHLVFATFATFCENSQLSLSARICEDLRAGLWFLPFSGKPAGPSTSHLPFPPIRVNSCSFVVQSRSSKVEIAIWWRR